MNSFRLVNYIDFNVLKKLIKIFYKETSRTGTFVLCFRYACKSDAQAKSANNRRQTRISWPTLKLIFASIHDLIGQ